MALTESLRLIIEAKTTDAVRGLKAVERELDLLERDAREAGRQFDRVGERNARIGALQKSINGVSAATGVSAERIKTFAATAAVAGAGLAAAFGVKSVQAASALNEQISKTNVVFGQASNSVLQFARNANAIGLSDRAAAEAASTFGTLFVNIGQTTQQAGEMSTQLVRLAADLASFNNTSLEQALQAIQSGLNGEQEPLRRFGVFLSDATLRAQALKQGLVDTTTQALTPQQRALAAYSQILAQTTLAQGDFERTSGGLANQQRILAANFEDLQAKLGSALTPAVAGAIGAFNDMYDTIDGVLVPGIFVLGQSLQALPKLIKIGIEVSIGGLGAAKAGLAAVKGGVDKLTPDFIHLGQSTSYAGSEAEKLDKIKRNLAVRAQFLAGRLEVLIPLFRGVGATSASASVDLATFSSHALAAARNVGALAAQMVTLQRIQSSLDVFRHLFDPPEEGFFSGQGNFVERLTGDLNLIVDRLRRDTQGAVAGGVGGGLEESKDEVDNLADYLQSVFQDRMEKLGNVFQGLSAKFSFDDALLSLDEARQKLADLQAEAGATKQSAAAQQSLVGQLLQQSLTITPEEALQIERAEQNLEDVKARFYGLATTTVAAPGSSFFGPKTFDVAGPKASLAELQVAEQALAKAKADAVGPTRELEEAERKLQELRDRQAELPKLIADAQRQITKAQLALVDAKRAEVDAGRELLYQGDEFIEQYAAIARQAGLTEGQIRNLTASMVALKQAAAPFEGLEDVFGTGVLFKPHREAVDIRNFIRGVNGDPFREQYAAGGYVPGPEGMPRLATVHGGELILNRSQQAGWGGVYNITISAWDSASIPAITRAVKNELVAIGKRG